MTYRNFEILAAAPHYGRRAFGKTRNLNVYRPDRTHGLVKLRTFRFETDSALSRERALRRAKKFIDKLPESR
jgi:hypothetical protein